jgi:hypothetical protein
MDATSSPVVFWFLRGIRPDGTYYGEIRSRFDQPRPSDNAHGVIHFVEGKMAWSDVNEVFRIAAILRTTPDTHVDKDVHGVLADGPINQPTILVRFHGNPPSTERNNLFLEIIRIVSPYLSGRYAMLSEGESPSG